MKQLDIFGITDVGCVRSGNEDCFLIQPLSGSRNELNKTTAVDQLPDKGLFAAVSDGMGGAAAGEVASSMTLVKTMDFLYEKLLQEEEHKPDDVVSKIESGIQYANQQVANTAMNNYKQRGMGATLTAMMMLGDVAYFFQVGDSRAFVFRDGAFCPVTRDQSFVGQLLEMGTITPQQAARHPQRNVILQALGTQDVLKVDISFLPLCKGDRIILCSDGLHSELDEALLYETIQKGVQNLDSIEQIVQSLLTEAKKSGGQDNITIIGLHLKDGYPPRQPGEDPALLPYPFLEMDNPMSKVFKI